MGDFQLFPMAEMGVYVEPTCEMYQAKMNPISGNSLNPQCVTDTNSGNPNTM
jgi:hypothetical protein